MMKNIFTNTWYPKTRVLISELSGDINIDEIEKWEQSLKRLLSKMEPDSQFKIFINLHGLKAIDLVAHKRFRTIVPTILAEYNWKVGYVNLFEDEAKDLVLKSDRGITCVAAAHCHDDETKIERYDNMFGKPNERFFTDPVVALDWLNRLEV